MPVQQTNLYEQRSPLTTLQKLGFVEQFMGSDIDTNIWNKSNGSGVGTFRMSDEIDEGYQIISAAANSDNSDINFNNVRPFSHTASLFLAAWRVLSTASIMSFHGLSAVIGSGSLNSVMSKIDSLNTHYGLESYDGSAGSTTASDIANDTAFHNHQIQCGSSDLKYWIDDVLKVTKTTNRPTTSLQPRHLILTRTTASKTTRIKYCEALNL